MENFKSHIDQTIDQVTEKEKESLLSLYSGEELEKIEATVDNLKQELKEILFNEGDYLDGDVIDEMEWVEIFEAMPVNLLEPLGISDFKKLAEFAGGVNYEVELDPLNIKSDSDSNILDSGYEAYQELGVDYFSSDKFLDLSDEVKLGIIGKFIDIKPVYFLRNFDSFKDLPNAQSLFEKSFYSLTNDEYMEVLKGGIGEKLDKEYVSLMLGARHLKLADLQSGERLIAVQGQNKDLEALLKDPALMGFSEVKEAWFDTKMLNDLNLLNDSGAISSGKFANIQAVIARNLYFQNLPINQENVVEEVARILKMREEYKDVHIFKDRNVVAAAHLQELTSGEMKFHPDKKNKKRFGTLAFAEAIKGAGGKMEGGIIRSKSNSKEDLSQAGMVYLDQIRNSPPPSTFVFDGHGAGDYIRLADEVTVDGKVIENDDSNKIFLKDFYLAYKEHIENSPDYYKDGGAKDIILLSACYNANFMASFNSMCEADGITKPIILGESEYGQMGYSEFESSYGETMFEQIFSKDYAYDTLGNFMMVDWDAGNSNPTLYIPDDQNTTTQLAEREVYRALESANDEIYNFEKELDKVA